MKLFLIAALCLGPLAFAAPADACNMAQPAQRVILTVEGQIETCNNGLEARFDLAMLEALPKAVVKTANPWEPGIATYEGVPLAALLSAVQANGTVIRITALNDYRADMDVADAASTGAILAYRRNGAQIPVREKGPLFVVFPFTEHPFLLTEQRYAQSVWQVARITVK